MLKVIDLFSGIGAVEMALRDLKIPFEVVAISEIDKSAINIYEKIHGKKNNLGDIKKIESLPECDYLHFSSPCQSFSYNAKATGNLNGLKGKSGIIVEVYRLFEDYKKRNCLPKYFTFENVENLVKKFSVEWEYFLDFFDKIGYNVSWKILNAKDFNTPQERKRVIAVGIRKDLNKIYEFPNGKSTEIKIKDILEPHEEVDEEYYHPDIRAKERHFRKLGIKKFDAVIENGYFYTEKSTTRHQTNRIYNINGYAPTLTTVPQINIEVGTERLRRITPLETWRLMGFSDEDFDKIKDGSKSSISKACGNSIAVEVIKSVLNNIDFSLEK